MPPRKLRQKAVKTNSAKYKTEDHVKACKEWLGSKKQAARDKLVVSKTDKVPLQNPSSIGNSGLRSQGLYENFSLSFYKVSDSSWSTKNEVLIPSTVLRRAREKVSNKELNKQISSQQKIPKVLSRKRSEKTENQIIKSCRVVLKKIQFDKILEESDDTSRKISMESENTYGETSSENNTSIEGALNIKSTVQVFDSLLAVTKEKEDLEKKYHVLQKKHEKSEERRDLLETCIDELYEGNKSDDSMTRRKLLLTGKGMNVMDDEHELEGHPGDVINSTFITGHGFKPTNAFRSSKSKCKRRCSFIPGHLTSGFRGFKPVPTESQNSNVSTIFTKRSQRIRKKK